MEGRYPPWERIASPTELRKYYESARKEIIDYKNSARIANAGTKMIAQDKEKYKKEAKKAGYWSGGATIAVTILYETWKVVGFPGGREWMAWWEHEAIYGVIVWCSTVTLGWIYKASHSGK